MSALPAAFLAAPIAHRGLHDLAAGQAENSLSAILAAAAAGYGVEIDVQRSADGEAMVFHDATLDRMTAERGPVAARTAAELGRIGLRGRGEPIPTLEAALRALSGRVPLLVEIKDQGGRFDETGVGPLERRVAALLRDYPGPVAVMSFNPASVAEMARLSPGTPRGVVAGAAHRYAGSVRPESLARAADAERLGAAFVTYEWRLLPTPATDALRAAGLRLLSWTIRSEAEERAARAVSDNVTFEGYAAAIPR